MITSMTYTPVGGTGLTLNDLNYPLHEFESTVPTKVTYVDRPYADGSYEPPIWRDKHTIVMQGAILATDADDLNTKRRNLKKAFAPGIYGNLSITMDNYPEALGLFCVNTSCEVALSALSPAFAEFQVELTAPTPGFVGALDTFTYTTPGTVNPVIAGDWETYPVVRLTGPQTNPALSGDISLAFTTLTLTAGQYVEFNLYTRQFATNLTGTPLDGLNYIFYTPLKPGTRSITWAASTSSAGREFKITCKPIYAI